MGQWYRNGDWSPAIEAEFEARLARSRGQKAQYLRIQGSLLKDSHPDVAVRLFERCVAAGDDVHIAAAFAEAAHAWYRLGRIDEALASLESAIEQEGRQPMFRTAAAFDYAMLVALHGREERFDRALAVVDTAVPLLPVMEFQAEAARAIILAARGRRAEACAAAERALAAEQLEAGWIPGHPEVGIVAEAANPLSLRVRAILAESGTA